MYLNAKASKSLGLLAVGAIAGAVSMWAWHNNVERRQSEQAALLSTLSDTTTEIAFLVMLDKMTVQRTRELVEQRLIRNIESLDSQTREGTEVPWVGYPYHLDLLDKGIVYARAHNFSAGAIQQLVDSRQRIALHTKQL